MNFDERKKAVFDRWRQDREVFTAKRKTDEEIEQEAKRRAELRKEREERNRPLHTYTVNKRSLPVGINKPVIWGLSQEEAQAWIKDHNKTTVLDVHGTDVQRIIYFDAVKDDGKEHSIYENECTKKTLLKVSTKKDVEIQHGYDNWQG